MWLHVWTNAMLPSHRHTNLLAIVSCLLWSTAFVGIKIGLAYTTPIHFAGVRFFIAGLLLAPLAGHPIANLKIVRQHLGFLLKVALLCTVLLYAFFYLGVSLGMASVSAIVGGASPLFVALLAHFLMPDDRLTVRKSAALLIGVTGIVAIAAGRFHFDPAQGRAFLGVCFLVAANFFSAYGNIIIAKSRQAISPLLLSSAQLIIGGAMLMIISFVAEAPDLSIKPLRYYGALAYLSLLSASAISIWFVLLKRPGVKVSELNIWKFLIPVCGAILSWTILRDDKPDATAVIGMCLIAVSLVLIHIDGKHKGYPD